MKHIRRLSIRTRLTLVIPSILSLTFGSDVLAAESSKQRSEQYRPTTQLAATSLQSTAQEELRPNNTGIGSAVNHRVRMALDTILALETLYGISKEAPNVLLANGEAPTPLPRVALDRRISYGNHLAQLELQSQMLREENRMDERLMRRAKRLRERILNWNP